MYCPNCGTEFADGVNFCHKCGTQRPQPKVATENSTEQPIPPSPISDTPIGDAKPADQAADATSSASKDASSAKKKSKLPLILGIIGVVIVAFIVIAALLGGDDSPEISTVRNGYLGEYTDMTVDEILDGYYSDFLGYESGAWDSGVTDDGKTIVQVEYTNEELGPITIQFSMLDDDCFKVTAFVDPLEDVEEFSDLLASLNKIYLLAYTSRFPQEEIAEKETELLEKLASVNATSVRYGASKGYTGDRSQLYELFGDTQLEMNVVRLLDVYGVINLLSSPDLNTDSTSTEPSDSSSTMVFSSGTFATVSDASSAYENGGIVVDLTVNGNQVMYTVTSISASQRIASISGVADQDSTIYASGDDGWGNIVKGNIAAMDDNFISVEFEVVTSNADAMWELDCPYTILTRCTETGLTSSFDITNIQNDPTTFTDTEFSMLPALDESIILLNDEHKNAPNYLAPYVNSWVNVFNISPSELLDSDSIIIGTGGMVYSFVNEEEYNDARAQYLVSNSSTTNIVGYLVQVSNGEQSIADYQILDCISVNGIVGDPYLGG